MYPDCGRLCIQINFATILYFYQQIPMKSVVKYLGVFINSQLKWSDHVKYTTGKASWSCSIVRPILEYASPIWCLHLTKDVSQLESVQWHAAGWVCDSRRNSTSHTWSKPSETCIDELKWSSLHTRRSFSSVCLTHDILHKRVSIPFSIFFCHYQFH